ncbi:MAG: 4-alpha-glucanotransferase [Burkholderiaceae bacterium]|nr:4-alpha-glucanotransferase [Burkholderiaceae bacterium]
MPLPRRSGILLHPTSLPGPYGCGDLGASAYHFIDWLVTARQSLWQVLPLGDTGIGNSPYMSPSAFAGNVLLIDLVALRDAGWLDDADLAPDPGFEQGRVNYPLVSLFRLTRLRKAARRFLDSASNAERTAFDAFCAAQRAWLDDYALFMSLKTVYGDETDWQDWPAPLAKCTAAGLREAAQTQADGIAFWKFSQWRFFEQWAKLKTYANARGIEIIGDVPIFVAPNSADVWAQRDLFDLNADGQPRVVAGVPPDKFSATGQHWGNPLYRWPKHAAQGYRWWIERMRHMLTLFDRARIDHFRGFEAYWEIPADAENALGGRWRSGPGAALFAAMHAQLGTLPFIAEDLGVITKEVNDLRKELGFPGMRILQFAFDHRPTNPYLPHNYHADTVVYTGTHDNDTTRGWWQSIEEHERDLARRYLSVSGDWIHWDLIRVASASVAAFAIFPMQDVLGLDSAHRMNRPGEATGSWEWRFHWGQVQHWHGERLAELTQLYGRCRGDEKPDLPAADAIASMP